MRRGEEEERRGERRGGGGSEERRGECNVGFRGCPRGGWHLEVALLGVDHALVLAGFLDQRRVDQHLQRTSVNTAVQSLDRKHLTVDKRPSIFCQIRS